MSVLSPDDPRNRFILQPEDVTIIKRDDRTDISQTEKDRLAALTPKPKPKPKPSDMPKAGSVTKPINVTPTL